LEARDIRRRDAALRRSRRHLTRIVLTRSACFGSKARKHDNAFGHLTKGQNVGKGLRKSGWFLGRPIFLRILGFLDFGNPPFWATQIWQNDQSPPLTTVVSDPDTQIARCEGGIFYCFLNYIRVFGCQSEPLHVLTNRAAGAGSGRTPRNFFATFFVTREETGYAILGRHFSWGYEVP